MPTLALTAFATTLASSIAIASTVAVPSDYPTVTAAISSGADTVLISEGVYPEIPVVDHRVVLLGLGITERPRLDGLVITNSAFEVPRTAAFVGLAFDNTVAISTPDYTHRNLTLAFRGCTFSAGLLHSDVEDPADIDHLTLTDCKITGHCSAVIGSIAMERDTVDGTVEWTATAVASIHNCIFTGGPGRAITLDGSIGYLRGQLSANSIANYDVGLYGYALAEYVIRNNVLTAISNQAVLLNDCETAIVDSNTVVDCGTGISVDGEYLYILDNVMRGSTDVGCQVECSYLATLDRNVIVHSGGHGLSIVMPSYSGSVVLRSNTIIDNAGSGISVTRQGAPLDGVIQASRNIIAGNAAWGLTAPQGESMSFACNDWFANTSGVMSPGLPGATDIFVDPQLCDPTEMLGFLQSTSPLVDWPGCGLIGARGVGCATTATTITRLRAEDHGAAILLRWEFGASNAPSTIWVERAAIESGPWRPLLSTVSQVDREWALLDQAVESATLYWYRVGWMNSSNAVEHSNAISAIILEDTHIGVIAPNPSWGQVSITWTTSSTGSVALKIYDVAGREIASLVRGEYGRGTHNAQWNGQKTDGHPAAAGLYFVRLQADGKIVSRPLLLRR